MSSRSTVAAPNRARRADRLRGDDNQLALVYDLIGSQQNNIPTSEALIATIFTDLIAPSSSLTPKILEWMESRPWWQNGVRLRSQFDHNTQLEELAGSKAGRLT